MRHLLMKKDWYGWVQGMAWCALTETNENKQVLMGIFPFAGGKSKKSLVVKMNDGAIMYPANWRQLSELKDFNFHLNLKGGAIGFLGAKSTVSISNRKVMPLKKTFGVSGKVTIKAYALGIRISTIKYDFFEEIDVEKGIVRQKFTAVCRQSLPADRSARPHTRPPPLSAGRHPHRSGCPLLSI